MKSFEAIEKMSIVKEEELPSIKINLKDTSIYAFSPRRMPYVEQKELREIVDDLMDRNSWIMERGIVKTSISP